jgi:hypothetical protein
MNRIKVDVLVCGAGCAGIGAALSAARNNARTLVIERAPFAGGILTATGLPYFDGIAHKTTGRIVVRGIAMELAVKMGMCAPDATTIKPHNPVFRSTEAMKLQLDQMLTAHGEMMSVLYDTRACAVNLSGSRVKSVVIANKDGLTEVEAEEYIDCSGDADVAFWAGVPCEKNAQLMPMTMHFRIGNVDRAKLGPKFRETMREALVAEHEAGNLPLFYGPGVMFMFADNEMYIHAIRVSGDATIAADLTRAEMQGRRDVWTMFNAWKKKVAGFDNAYLIMSGPYIGIRETRRVVGQYVLSEQDIRARRMFDDAVATGCWYLDVHPNQVTLGSANIDAKGFQPEPYDIPYGSIVASKVENLLVAGRCHSATSLAASSSRVTITAMALGQAAGTAAAVAVKRRTTAAALDGKLVRETLAAQGAGPFTV